LLLGQNVAGQNVAGQNVVGQNVASKIDEEILLNRSWTDCFIRRWI